MKRQLTVALGLVVIATPALATKARMEALGEDSFGSYYINDNRNIFLNPARINENKDLVTYEFGAAGDSITAADAATTPRAGGGFTKSHGNMVYGLHFGDSSTSTGTVRAVTGANLQEVQPWDFFIGGDAGMKWGASFTYENYDGAGRDTQDRLLSHGMRVRGGVLMGDLDLFAHVSLNNKAQDFNGNKVEGDMGLFLGAGYMLNNYKLFLDWRKVDVEYDATNGALADIRSQDANLNIMRLGAARQERLNDRATIFAKAMVVRTTLEDDGGNSFATATARVPGESTDLELPLVVGLEYAATSWLDLRASVVQNVFSQSEFDPKAGSKSSNHIANTSVRAGASLKFGEFAIDGLIATGSAGDNTDNTVDTTGGNGNLRTDSLMTRVSMIYRF